MQYLRGSIQLPTTEGRRAWHQGWKYCAHPGYNRHRVVAGQVHADWSIWLPAIQLPGARTPIRARLQGQPALQHVWKNW
jgi:hypothetical protein